MELHLAYHLKASTGTKCSSMGNISLEWQMLTLLFCKQYWLLVYLWSYLQDAILSFKSLHGMGLGIWETGSTHLISSDKCGILWVLSAKQIHLMGPRRWAFSVMTSPSGILLPQPKVRLTLTQMTFRKCLKT